MAKLSNFQLDNMLSALSNCSTAGGIVGFAIARNYRIIASALTEYLKTKNEIIQKYGDEDENGNLSVTDPEKLKAANKELSKYASLTQEVNIMKVPEDAFIESGLKGYQIILLGWMTQYPEETKDTDNSVMLSEKDSERFGI